ncbi:MAG: SDR family NAD(P)-dependent oxidoreductase, partial [Alphaproteobacteria bacterium]|nr:SDR family NAD(P)-dependent oxidoreductase [Alphaproteobacteria bacterium]
VEAHGTGTRLGDPVEIMALTRAWRRHTDRTGFCWLGSVKPNIGHLDAAAGLAGVVKAALCLSREEIPPLANFSQTNPEIDFDATPFRIPTRLMPWPAEGKPRRAAVSAFGVGGANAHAILEDWRETPAQETGSDAQLIVLSAREMAQTRLIASRLAERLRRDAPPLADIAFTLQVGRRAFAHRAAFIARDLDSLRAQLDAFAAGETLEGCISGEARGDALISEDERDALMSLWLANGRLERLARAFVDGLDIDWPRLHAGRLRRRVHLPTYPFAGEPFWPEQTTATPAAPAVHLFAPVWRAQAAHEGAAPRDARRLVLLCGFDEARRDALAALMPDATIARLRPDGADLADRYAAVAAQALDLLRPLAGDFVRKTLVQLIHADDGEEALSAGLAGLLASASAENPKILTQTVAVAGDETAPALGAICAANAASHAARIRYAEGRRLVLDLAPVAVKTPAPSPWKERGVYLISGGFGGLALIFAREIARQAPSATLVLVSRAAPAPQRRKELEALGLAIDFRLADISDASAVARVVSETVARHGAIDGVIHAAGTLRDAFLAKKTQAQLHDVLAAKVGGAVHLDAATRDLPLDFFVLFSSAAGALGAAGQADYAAANAFLDAFADYRTGLAATGARRGLTLAIGWPLWREGGMRVDAATLDALRETGLTPLETAAGIAVFNDCLASCRARTLVLSGDGGAVARLVARKEAREAISAKTIESAPADPATLLRETTDRLKTLLAEVTGAAPQRIQAHARLEDQGLDSIAVTQLNQRLGRVFDGLAKTILYRFPTLAALAAHLVTERGAECAAWTDASPRASAAAQAVGSPAIHSAAQDAPRDDEPIAIIGASGRFAQAETLDDFWDNLASGRDCVGDIPADRWPLAEFFEEDVDRAVARGASYARRGGFIDGAADFDPLFFNIAPREAMALDPQERLFLQCAYEALEDAAYTRARLREQFSGRVGVFVGVTKRGFELYGPDLWRAGQTLFPQTSFGSIANRVSYCLDLSGPSLPIDTMCSAGLTALHEACRHILDGDCEMAIAGGVNLYLHFSTYVGLCANRMLSRDGRCKSFGAGGDGFTPGEGVGALLLKRLSQAERDGDVIHGLIRATGVNHGGRTNGYTVPSPQAQAALIRDCLDRAGLDARTISYVEAHGTGTALGDPIEVAGLTDSFRADTADSGFCALGSVKSNIGHCEAAAGIAGVLKVVLQMRHGRIAPTLHAAMPNPNIDFSATPFRLAQELEVWARPVVDGNDTPRRAGVSSFGAGGANAHAVLEEYIAPPPGPDIPEAPALILLSARTDERLRAQAARLRVFLARQDSARDSAGPGALLRDIAYTLQTGREHFETRAAALVSSLAELNAALGALAGGETTIFRQARIDRDRDALAAAAADPELQARIDGWIAAQDHAPLIDHWLRGVPLDWERLNRQGAPRRLSLPAYPFARQRLWLADAQETQETPRQDPAPEPILLRPVWDPVAPPSPAPLSHKGLLVIGSADARRQALVAAGAIALTPPPGATIDEMAALLRGQTFDHLVWIAPDANASPLDPAFASEQDACALALFRLVKALLAEGHGERDMTLTAVTTQAVAVFDGEPVHAAQAAVHGLMGSLSREIPRWRIRALDAADAPWPAPHLLDLPVEGARSYAWRGREWFVPSLAPLRGETDAAATLRAGGVYVVIGGAGGLGEIWSRAALRDHGARLVWLGRSELSATIQTKLDALARIGAPPLYLRADARDPVALAAARSAILDACGRIDGVIVSTLGAYDKSLGEMEEALWREILSTKIDVAAATAQVFRDDPLDFLLFFSSMAAFARPGGMAAYCAATVGADACALALARALPFPLRVVNWGYWSAGGGARVSEATRNLVEARGVAPLEAGEEGPALAALLSGPLPQIAATRTRRPELIETYAGGEWTLRLRADGPAPIAP